MRFLLLLICSLTLTAQSSFVIGWVSDHGVCVPHGSGFTLPTNPGQRGTDCIAQRDVQAMVNSWEPDFLITTGDLSNRRGNAAETYNGLLIRTLTAVTSPAATTSTLQETISAGATAAQTVDVSVNTSVGTYVINFGQSNAEVIEVTARTTGSPPTITAKFYKSHAIGEPIALNSQIITVDTTAGVDCGPIDCKTDMMLVGTERTFTVGTDLTNIVCLGGTCTATITNSEKAWKANDEVIVDGEEDLDGTYSITASSPPTSASVISWASAATGTYTTVGMNITTRRLVFANTYVGLDEENVSVFEMPKITAATKTTFTATFAHPHDAGVVLRGSDHITVLDWVRQGKLLPVMGNHDHGGCTTDWCDNISGNLAGPFNTYWSSAAAGSWPLSTLTYHAKTYGTNPAGNPLVQFFATATSGPNSPSRGGAQELYFTPLMAASTAKWNIALTHYPVYSDTTSGALNAFGVGTNPITNYGWIAGANIDAVLSGHTQYPEHVTARNDANDATFPFERDGGQATSLDYIIMSSSGDSLSNVANITAGGNCADGDVGCTVIWGSTDAGGDVANDYMAGKITISDTELKIEYFDRDDWVTPIHTITLTKDASTPSDPCALATTVCFSGGVKIQ
jgi:hypothetical protein